MTAEISTRQEVKLLSQVKEATTTTSPLIMGAGEKTSYTLSYFDMRGRAEPIRLLFAIAEVKYTDRRIGKSEWPELKATMPFGQLPVLEISGGGLKKSLKLNQTHSILRYLAREFGLDGRTSVDKVKVDIIVETMQESMEPIVQIFNEGNDQKKAEILAKYCEDLLPRFLEYLTDNLSEEWFLDQISLADVAIYGAFDNLSMFLPDFLNSKSYWKLQDWKARFESHPQISEWLANRPITPY